MNFISIGTISSPFTSIEGMPIQPSGAEGSIGEAHLDERFAEGLRDLEGFSHIILIYYLHCMSGYALEVTPFLDTVSHGVFATRSPKRPNPIGISIVRLLSVGENVVRFENPDMLDGTPLLDIKPYVAAFDRVTPDREGWFAGKSECAVSRRSDGRFKES